MCEIAGLEAVYEEEARGEVSQDSYFLTHVQLSIGYSTCSVKGDDRENMPRCALRPN